MVLRRSTGGADISEALQELRRQPEWDHCRMDGSFTESAVFMQACSSSPGRGTRDAVHARTLIHSKFTSGKNPSALLNSVSVGNSI
jgi:hypothetical protein